MRALVCTDRSARDRKTLAAVRSLGRAGWRVDVAADRMFSEPMLSRYCRRRVRLRVAFDDPEPFIQSLLEHLSRHEYDAVLPLTDHTMIALSMNRERVNAVVPIAVPPPEALAVAGDKLATQRLADKLGIKTPQTYAPESKEQLDEIADAASYPAIYKIRGGGGAAGLRIVRDPSELREAYLQRPPEIPDLLWDYRPLVQELIPGEQADVCMLFNRGEPRAVVTQRRVRMYPETGGAGTVIETTHDPATRDLGVKLFRALEWHGPGQAEFRIDSRDGTPTLLEINGRFWGSTDLGARAGVDFPLLNALLARDGDVAPVLDHEVGVRYRWPLPFGALAVLRGSSRREALSTFFMPAPGVHSDLSLSDPLPLLGQLRWTLKELLGG